jgi:hypothetical protein
MTDTPDGGPAFPPMIKGAPLGMSMRDYFAGQALAGMWSRDDVKANGVEHMPELRDFIANHAYHMADAMLAARKAKP